MEAPSLKSVAREAKPLQPLSPKRLNERAMDRTPTQTSPTRKANLFADYLLGARTEPSESVFGLPQSPSLPEIHAFRSHVRTNSDVQGLVKRFEHLDVRDRDAEFTERKKRHEAELRRAQIAREEAESDAKKLREEVRKLKKEGEESRERERKVGKRLEVVMEEFATSKDGYTTQMTTYEKENRKARKEAFKSSSAVVKLQEELKATRNTLRVAQSNLEMEKLKVRQRDQDAFNAQYQLVALQEELETLKCNFSAVEQEKEALKANLKEEEVARIAAEGMIALPTSTSDDDLQTSPRRRSPQKRPASPLSDDKENMGIMTKKALEARRLEEEISRERMLRKRAEELLDFLQAECHFRCCSCRVPEPMQHDNVLALSQELNETMASIKKDMRAVFHPEGSNSADDEDMDQTIRATEPTEVDSSPDVEMTNENADPVPSEDVDTSVTMAEATSDDRPIREQPIENPVPTEPTQPVSTPRTISLEMEPDTEDHLPADALESPIEPPSPPGPHRTIPPRQRPSIRTITTTTTIPMQFSPIKAPAPPLLGEHESSSAIVEEEEHAGQPSGLVLAPVIDREAALAAIAYRRGRAKSIANGHATPRKQMIEGVNPLQRRDISAPQLGQSVVVAAMGAGKGSASVGRAGARVV